MKCEICGREYWTKECLSCKNQKEKIPLSEKDKLYKVIRYAIIFFIGIFIIGGIAEIYIFNKAIETAQPTIKNMNEMTNTINKANEKMNEQLLKQIEKIGK